MESMNEINEDTAVIVLHDPVELAAALRFELHRVLLDGARSVVIDAASVDAIPSATVAALRVANRTCRNRGGQVFVRNPSRVAMKQLDRSGLLLVFQIENGVSPLG